MAQLNSTTIIGDLDVTGYIFNRGKIIGAGENVTGLAFDIDGSTNNAKQGAERFNSSSNRAIGENSHAEGWQTRSMGMCSHSQGSSTKAEGEYSDANGYFTIANAYQTVVGKYNTRVAGPSSSSAQDGSSLFIVGSGTSSTAGRNAFRVQANGSCYMGGTLTQNSADYAEFFEWKDGNPEGQDRRGHFVRLDGEKIVLAQAGEDYIGLISGAPSILGNAAPEEWHNRYLKDIFGAVIYEEEIIPEYTNEETGKITPEVRSKHFAPNPDFDPNMEYIPRELRPEWGIVGLLGQIIAVDDGTCVVGGHAGPGKDGVATAAETGYRVMKRIDDSHIKVLVK